MTQIWGHHVVVVAAASLARCALDVADSMACSPTRPEQYQPRGPTRLTLPRKCPTAAARRVIKVDEDWDRWGFGLAERVERVGRVLSPSRRGRAEVGEGCLIPILEGSKISSVRAALIQSRKVVMAWTYSVELVLSRNSSALLGGSPSLPVSCLALKLLLQRWVRRDVRKS